MSSPRRSRRRLWLGGAVVAAIALGAGGFLLGTDNDDPLGTSPPPGGPTPPIELPRLGGEGTVSLDSFRGRPVVVNFFASWCGPCRKELPAFQAVSQRLGDKVAFLGVDHQDDRAGGLEMLRTAGVRYPAGYDPEGRTAAAYGLFGMPTTLFFSADGRLLEKHTGELSRDQLERKIARHFDVR
jgi:cytochrome c biogenesis protein CcmG, thiol:disulfide interchange protein DsbE